MGLKYSRMFSNTHHFFIRCSLYLDKYLLLSVRKIILLYFSGLKWVYYMTKDRSNDLRIDMISQIDKRRVYSKHSYFRLGEPSNYTLNFNSYHDSGTAGKKQTKIGQAVPKLSNFVRNSFFQFYASLCSWLYYILQVFMICNVIRIL